MILVSVFRLHLLIVRVMGAWDRYITCDKVSMRGRRFWFTMLARKGCAGFAWMFFCKLSGKVKE